MPSARKIVGAVAQVAQEFFDTQANLDKAIAAIHDAAKQGADIVVFAECYLGQYLYWAQFYDNSAENYYKVWIALYDGAITVAGDECRAIAVAAMQSKTRVGMGCNELS